MKRILNMLLVFALACQLMLPAAAVDGNYRVSVADTMYGLVAISTAAAEAGTRVYFEGRPSEGFETASLRVEADGKELETEIVGGLHSFIMPATVVTIYATFEFVATELFPFADVPEDAWCREAVEYVFERGVMTGADSEHFLPAEKANRAMIWTILARDALVPLTQGEGKSWYDDARTWANAAGISDGTNPLGTITREELAAMLYRYAQKNGEGFTGSWMFLLRNPDAQTISPWANEAMHWCVMKGILSGRADGSLDPQGEATRAEVAAVMMRFMEREK